MINYYIIKKNILEYVLIKQIEKLDNETINFPFFTQNSISIYEMKDENLIKEIKISI